MCYNNSREMDFIQPQKSKKGSIKIMANTNEVWATNADTRQRRLYNFLKRRGNHFTLQQTVADALPKFYAYDSRYNFHDSSARMWMTKDIQTINDSPDYEKIIISSASGIKLSTKREFTDYIKSQYALVWSKYHRTRRKEQKGAKDGQSVLGDSAEGIDHIIEAFIGEDE